ncbi:dienelactone hydrolase family protein [Bdellovibrio sp. HCB337]|uniref:dienelactone hydrolase family protein n=1 Tax=Bdellovibrio sp. HCB337 TaxID=3394358 RepID=UPI0039A4724D
MKHLFVFFMLIASTASAAIQTEVVNYKDGNTDLEGYIAYDDKFTGPRPVVYIVHQWTGVSDYEQMRARMIAELGYVGFAIDVYGKGIRPTDPAERTRLSDFYKAGNRALFRQREMAALEYAKTDSRMDASKAVAIGYCFGGTGALELARAGAAILGAVSFHGALTNPNPQDVANMKMPTMVHHGAIDPFVPPTEVMAFINEMNTAKVDYAFTSYANAVHSFTDKNAGNDPSKGAAYDEKADKRSWSSLVAFLKEVFGE